MLIEPVIEDERLSSAGLNVRHVAVLALIYCDGLTQDQVAPLLGITRQRVSQLQREAKRLLTAAGLPVPSPRPKRRLRYFDGRLIEQSM